MVLFSFTCKHKWKIKISQVVEKVLNSFEITKIVVGLQVCVDAEHAIPNDIHCHPVNETNKQVKTQKSKNKYS